MRRGPLILSVTILAAILGGFTLGAMLSGQKEYQDDPVLVALDLFREICIPVSNGARPPFLQNKFDFTISELGPTWIDRPTGMSATVSDLGCSVSDVLNPLSIANRDRFAATAAAHTIEVFPQLSHHDVDAPEGWELYRAWMSHPSGDPRRWGILLYRGGQAIGRPETFLSISRNPAYHERRQRPARRTP